jgi:hypothetical protein
MRCCVACGRMNPDRAHIRSRGAGGPDSDFNIILLCRMHHSRQHTVGWGKFCLEYPSVKSELLKKGWEIDYLFGTFKMFHSLLAPIDGVPKYDHRH